MLRFQFYGCTKVIYAVGIHQMFMPKEIEIISQCRFVFSLRRFSTRVLRVVVDHAVIDSIL